MQVSATRAAAIRTEAENYRKQLENRPEGWQNSSEPKTEVNGQDKTEFRWYKGPQGETLDGFESFRKGQLERFNVTSGKVELDMRVCPHPAKYTAGLGESITRGGFALSAGVPGGWLVGMPLMSLGQFLSHSHTQGPDTVYRREGTVDQIGGTTEWAVFDASGNFVSDQPREFQQLRFD